MCSKFTVSTDIKFAWNEILRNLDAMAVSKPEDAMAVTNPEDAMSVTNPDDAMNVSKPNKPDTGANNQI